jgi:hypothetical protein
MMFKLGDNTFKKHEEEIESDILREESQVSKIRELIKKRNKEWGEKNRLHQKAPGAKRRKRNEETYAINDDQEKIPHPETQPRLKRKTEKRDRTRTKTKE